MEASAKYFFTHLKKLEQHHTRFICTLVGGGSWKGQKKGKPVGAKKFGIKKTYNYEEIKKNGRGNNDDDDDDDTQPQEPNASRYGDQLPQQMVKPMQNIESQYVGCDDELMNDMITQPQWPVYNYEPSQLIVTCPMVKFSEVGKMCCANI
ncbi:hypothetical protein H5410_057215 [Solanum commersonii]|uniref:Uncharacterized protein n=1 Tax=Solanum commersonii TaxID=4109 RepID=A0A9J5WMD7_SOLCO|nr:hypothetical protein H5410_057215 [Solanum commersonii]